MDLTHGPVMKKMIVFAIPILLSALLQQTYHAADMIVVGNFAKDSTASLAAVGAVGSINALFLNLFLGLSVGANVICANLYGAGKKNQLRTAMHTSVAVGVISGLLLAVLGIVFSRSMLVLIDCPQTVIDEATTYLRILFIGQPASLLYNFGSGILRAHGDTKRPMYILTVTGLINVLLNLVFVIVFHLDSAGVALATTVANYLSAAVILTILLHPAGEYRLSLKELSLEKREVVRIAKIGIPCSLNGIVFSLANLLVTSAYNTLGAVALASNSAAGNMDVILHQILASFSAACVSFAGQNYGAKNLKRIDKLLWQSVLISVCAVMLVNAFTFTFPEFFMRIFTKDPDVIALGTTRIFVFGGGYVLFSLADMAIGCLRGMGKTLAPTILNATFVCLPRMIWVALIFPLHPTYNFLLICYPLSWALSSTAQFICYLYYRRKEGKLLSVEA
jgi:putative MATE family efflux protein